MSTVMTALSDSFNGTRESTIRARLNSPCIMTAILVPTPLIQILRDHCHDTHDVHKTVNLIAEEMTKTYNASLNKRVQVKSVAHFGPARFLEMMYMQLQQQKHYFETDLVEITHTCDALFRKMADAMLDPELEAERATDWGGSPGYMITRDVLRQLCASDASDQTLSRHAVTVLRAYIVENVSGTP